MVSLQGRPPVALCMSEALATLRFGEDLTGKWQQCVKTLETMPKTKLAKLNILNCKRLFWRNC